jgi:hypothetical protein
MAGGVWIIDNNKQTTTKTPNPPTTSMLTPPHSISAEQFDCLNWRDQIYTHLTILPDLRIMPLQEAGSMSLETVILSFGGPRKAARRMFFIGAAAAICAMVVLLACQGRPPRPVESQAHGVPGAGVAPAAASLPERTGASSEAQLLRQVESAVSRSVPAPMEPLLELEPRGQPRGDIR